MEKKLEAFCNVYQYNAVSWCWGKETSVSVFSERIGLLCDGVHNEVCVLNWKDLTFLRGMKGSESSPGM